MTFDPKNYWEKRGKNYIVKTPYDFTNEFNFLKLCLSKANLYDSPILEVGSGYGRLYKILAPYVSDYTMVDFVDSMRMKCLETTGRLPDHWDGKTLPYDDESFSTCILCSVLLHVPPRHIKDFLWEVIRVTDEFIYIASSTGKKKSRNKHCFVHDYKQLLTNMGLVVLSKRVFKNGERVNYWVRIIR